MVALSTDNTENVEVTSTTQEFTTEEKKTKIPILFSEGKRDYIAGNFETAAEKLGDATKFAVEVFGEKAAECFDAHFYYGKTLIEIGRSEDDIIKNAMKNMPLPEEEEKNEEAATESENKVEIENPDSLTDEERAEIKNQVEDALMETAAELEKETEESDETENVETKLDTSETKPVEESAVSESAPEESSKVEETPSSELMAEDSGKVEETPLSESMPVEENSVNDTEKNVASAEDTKEADEEENVDNEVENVDNEVVAEDEGAGDGNESESEEPTSIQLAWEVLEAARLICDSQDQNKEWELKKADVLMSLSECSIEDENYKQAVDDLNIALELQLKHECTGRILAETYFNLARTYRLDDDFKAAAEFYKKAEETLENKICELEKAVPEAEDEAKALMESELASLRELIPDIKMKVEDALASAKQTEQAKEALLSAITGTIPAVPTDEKPATVIEVRKSVKRPAPEEITECDEAKKAKDDEVVA